MCRSISVWIRASPIRWYAARPCFRTGRARPSASPCSRRGRTLKRPRKRVRISWGSRTWPRKSRVESWISMSSLPVRTPCVWSGSLVRFSAPRGLMPNPKVGTVTPDVASAVKNAKAGQVRYRTDKAGIIHCSIGKVGFEVGTLHENLAALLADLHKAKPAAAKGQYMQKITVSTTMGPGLAVDTASLEVQQQ